MQDRGEIGHPLWVGLGIRPELFAGVLQQQPKLAFYEAHSENYFGYSRNRELLLELADRAHVSLHGVGLSLGRADDLDQAHLRELRHLCNDVKPLFVSEHLAWSAYSHIHLPDLLPIPLNADSLNVIAAHISQMQDVLGRQILIENPSNYLLFDTLGIPEPEFINTLALKTGCGVLLDINNVYVSSKNLDRSASDYINELQSNFISQYHLAGHTPVTREWQGATHHLLIDTHNQWITQPVWDLFRQTIEQHGKRPTVIEWDSDYPPLSELLDECAKAEHCVSEIESKSTYKSRRPALLAQEVSHSPSDLAICQEQFLQSVLGTHSSGGAIKSSHQARIAIYQNNVRSAVHDYLAGVYPALRGVLGNDYFRQLTLHYLQHVPPQKGNIHDYGADLVTVFEKLAELKPMPYLADLTQFEWALHRAYFANTQKVITTPMVGIEIDQTELLTLYIRLNDSVNLIRSEYPLQAIWQQSLPDYDGEVIINLDQDGDSILVFKHLAVRQVVLEQEQALFIEQLATHNNLMQAIDALAGSLSQEQLADCVSFVLAHGLLQAA